MGQTKTVIIKVVNAKSEALNYSTVSLINTKDSTQRKITVTDSLGLAAFEADTARQYFINIHAIGYKPLNKALNAANTTDTFVCVLEASGKTLNEVVVKATRPMITQDDDKTVVDPELLAEASTNGYEILEKTPGLFVDQDGDIYLNSTTPAAVYINGREMKMSQQDMATMLKSLPPNAIDKIEIMRTPSAKYDASGSGGIVNVILKKGFKIGLTGSANAGFQQGRLGNQFAGANISNNNGATTTYLNLNYTRQNNYNQLNTDRVLAVDTLLSQKAYTTYPGNVFFAGFGINHDINKQWNISYDGRTSYNLSTNETDNTNTFKVISTDQLLGSTLTNLHNKSDNFLLDQDVAAKYKIDTAGSEWTVDCSYTYASNNGSQTYNTLSLLPTFGGDGTIVSRRNFLVVKSDLLLKLPHKLTMELGIKSSALLFNSNAVYYTETATGPTQPDSTRTNKYRYDENINAAYIQASKSFGDVILKTGVRLENTNMDGRQTIPGDTAFSTHRTDLFPYIYLSKKVMAIAGFDLRAYLVYRRTITRPSYDQLNPYPRYVDEFLSDIGNPSLRPQFTQNYEANISVGEHPLLAVGINDTKDLFSNVYYQEPGTHIQAYRTYDNIGTNREFYLRGFAAIPPGRKYFAVLGGQYNHNVYNGFYEGAPLSFTGDNWLFFTYHQLKIGKRSMVTLNGFYRLKGPLQFYELSQIASLNFSVNRKFFQDKLTVTLSATDIFYTNNNTFTINEGGVSASGLRQTDSRRYGLNLRYNFGFHKKETTDNMFNDQQDKVN